MRLRSPASLAIALTSVISLGLAYTLLRITGTDRWGTPLVLLGLFLNTAIVYFSNRRSATPATGSQEL